MSTASEDLRIKTPAALRALLEQHEATPGDLFGSALRPLRAIYGNGAPRRNILTYAKAGAVVAWVDVSDLIEWASGPAKTPLAGVWDSLIKAVAETPAAWFGDPFELSLSTHPVLVGAKADGVAAFMRSKYPTAGVRAQVQVSRIGAIYRATFDFATTTGTREAGSISGVVPDRPGASRSRSVLMRAQRTTAKGRTVVGLIPIEFGFIRLDVAKTKAAQ